MLKANSKAKIYYSTIRAFLGFLEPSSDERRETPQENLSHDSWNKPPATRT